LLPTLAAVSYGSNQGGGAGRVGPERPSLETMAKRGELLPTLTVCGNYNRKGLSPNSGDGLRTALLPTLCARDEKGPGPAHTHGGADLPRTLGGHLNPDWCLWFMGFPAGWLDVDDAPAFVRLAKSSCRTKPKSSAG
jgi:hypothetical protein